MKRFPSNFRTSCSGGVAIAASVEASVSQVDVSNGRVVDWKGTLAGKVKAGDTSARISTSACLSVRLHACTVDMRACTNLRARVCVCVDVRAYVGLSVCLPVCMYECMYAYYTHICFVNNCMIYLSIYIYIYIYIHIHIYIYIYIYIYLDNYICIYIYVYKYYTHTYIRLYL